MVIEELNSSNSIFCNNKKLKMLFLGSADYTDMHLVIWGDGIDRFRIKPRASSEIFLMNISTPKHFLNYI